MLRLLALLLASLTCLLAQAEAPTTTQIRQWWGDAPVPDERVVDHPVAITLLGGERAYLAAATDWNRGRNFANMILLVRPKLRQLRELTLGGSFKVQDVEVRGASLVFMSGSGSGQGTTVSMHSIVQIEGWKPVVLHKVRTADNLGACGDSLECRETSEAWKVSGGSDPDAIVLEETLVSARGKTPESLVRREKKIRYALVRGRFVPERGEAAPAATRP